MATASSGTHTRTECSLTEWQYPKSRLGLAAVLLKRGLVITGLWWMTRGLLSSIVVRERPAVIVLRYTYFAGLAALITLTNTWSVFLLYWLVPYCTWHMVIQYARLICEHSAVHSAAPAYQVTRTTIPTRLESLFILPRNIGYHIEHHWYPSVPFYRLPELHARLMQIPDFRLYANIKRSVLHSLVDCTRAEVHRSMHNLHPQRHDSHDHAPDNTQQGTSCGLQVCLARAKRRWCERCVIRSRRIGRSKSSMAMNCVSRCAAILVFRKRIAIQTSHESGTSRVCWRVMESPCSSQRYRRIATHGGRFATPPVPREYRSSRYL